MGILRVWNVSKNTPLANIRVKQTGFHALCVVSPPNNNSNLFPNGTRMGVSSTSVASVEASSGPFDISLPSTNVLCMFLDGGVGMYELGKRKWNFLREMVSTQWASSRI